MSYDTNNVTLIGRLTRDPELKYTAVGTAVCTFGLAVGDMPKDGQDTVSFFDVTCFGKIAESVSNHQKKGGQVCVTGKLRQDRWTNNKGENRSKIHVIAGCVQFLARPKDDTGTKNAEPDPSGANYDSAGFEPNPTDHGEPNF